MRTWYDGQLRIQQTVLREPDILQYDAERVVSYLKEIDANCLVVNAGGIVDFFRHDLATANPNPFMTASQDILADLTGRCHRDNIRIIARVDFRGVDRKFFDANRDWFSVSESGGPVYAGEPDQPRPRPLYAGCYLSYYRNEHAQQFINTLFDKYDIDGIWENSPFQFGVCYCDRCSSSYHADTGRALPRAAADDIAVTDYTRWKARYLLSKLAKLRQTVKSHGADKAFCAEVYGLFYEIYNATGADLYLLKEAMDFMVTPLFVADHEPIHSASTLIKFLKALDPSKVPVMLYGHLGTDDKLRYVSTSPAETRIWMWQAVSTGGSLWNTTFNGQHPGLALDRRNAYISRDVFRYMKQHEVKLHHQLPVSDVKVLFSNATSVMWAASDRTKDKYITHVLGLEAALLERHIQYEFILDRDLSLDALTTTKLLIAPNAAVLTNAQVDIIRGYVQAGGRLLATWKTSLFETACSSRRDFGLADVFGCNFTGIETPVSDYGYQRINDQSHPLARGFEQTELIANWGDMLLVNTNDASAVAMPLSHVPVIHPQPPEWAWLGSMETKFPAAVVNTFGQGQCIYFPSPIDRNVWAHGHRDFSTLITNAVDLLLDDVKCLKTNAPPSVQIVLNRVAGRPGQFLLHFINTTSAPRRPISQLVPVERVEVVLSLPGGMLVSSEQLGGDSVTLHLHETTRSADRVEIEACIEGLQEYVGIAIDLAA